MRILKYIKMEKQSEDFFNNEDLSDDDVYELEDFFSPEFNLERDRVNKLIDKVNDIRIRINDILKK